MSRIRTKVYFAGCDHDPEETSKGFCWQCRIAELEAEVKRLIIIAAHATAEARVASGEFDKADFEMMLVARGFANEEKLDLY